MGLGVFFEQDRAQLPIGNQLLHLLTQRVGIALEVFLGLGARGRGGGGGWIPACAGMTEGRGNDGRRAFSVLAAQGREQDDVADAGAVGQQHHQAVDTDAATSGGRHAVFEGAHEVGVVEHGLVIARVLG